MDTESLFHDHSTSGGKLRIFCNRLSWKWITAGILGIGLLAWGIAYDSSLVKQVEPTAPPIIDNSIPNLQATFTPDGVFTIAAQDPTVLPVLSQDIFSLAPTFDKNSLTHLHLQNVEIEAPVFSNSLQGSSNLEKITLEKVMFTGEFNRIYLPKLREFSYNQHHRTLDIDDYYKMPQKMKDLLFFEFDLQKSWEIEDIGNMGLNVSVSMGDTVILKICPVEGIINLNVRYCDAILNQTTTPFTDVSLTKCRTTSGAIPAAAKFLNLNNATPDSGEIAKILARTRQLEEFHGLKPFLCENLTYLDFPEKYPSLHGELQIVVNLVQFPSTIRTISISKLQLTSDPIQPSPITSLALEQCNLTGITQDFNTIFPNLKKFALFNLTRTQDPYTLLNSALDSSSAETVIMEGFKRGPKIPEEDAVEARITAFGVPSTSTNFILDKTGSGAWAGREMTDLEKNTLRFELLAFNSIHNSFEDFMKFDSRAYSGYVPPLA